MTVRETEFDTSVTTSTVSPSEDSDYYTELELEKVIDEQRKNKENALAMLTDLLGNSERPLEHFDFKREYEKGKIVVKLVFLAPKLSRQKLTDALRINSEQ